MARDRQMVKTVRPWANSDDAHFRVEKTDVPSAGSDYERMLRVSPALPNGVHIGVSIWGVNGTEDQHQTGINLTPAEAIRLVEHIAKVLAHGDWDPEDGASA